MAPSASVPVRSGELLFFCLWKHGRTMRRMKNAATFECLERETNLLVFLHCFLQLIGIWGWRREQWFWAGYSFLLFIFLLPPLPLSSNRLVDPPIYKTSHVPTLDLPSQEQAAFETIPNIPQLSNCVVTCSLFLTPHATYFLLWTGTDSRVTLGRRSQYTGNLCATREAIGVVWMLSNNKDSLACKSVLCHTWCFCQPSGD